MTNAVSRDLAIQMVVPATSKAGENQIDNGNAFADSMLNAAQSGAENAVANVKNDNSMEIQSAFDKAGKTNQVKDALNNSQTNNDTKLDEQAKQDAASQTSDKIKKEIAEELDVSEEEVEAAMENLGFNWMDLLQNGNMAMLVGELTGEDAIAALTDEGAFLQIENLVSDVQDILQELQNELAIDENGLAELMNTTEIETVSVNDDVTNDQQIAEMVQVNEGPVVEVVSDEKPETIVNSKVDHQMSETERLDAFDTSGMNEVMQNAKADKKQSFEQSASGNDNAQFSGLQQNLQQVNAEGVQEPVFTEGMDHAQRAQEIIDQIADHVKIHHSQQITEMEIQLNPASLGNVHLQVASKDGVITAQMIAQNEAVKAALDSQLLQLKESLEAQGLKVNEVEVTVASHQFEENLDQQGREDQEQAMQQSNRRNSRRILNLDQLDAEGIDGGENEELTDAELLQVEMMRLGGNKLNFRV